MTPTPDLPLLRLRHPSGATAAVHPRGAQLVSWTPAAGGEAIFLSRRAEFAPGRAIRGGVPVIFPQFAELGPLPKHGFARTREWEVVEAAAERARLRLREDDATLALWPHAFRLEISVALEARGVTVELEVHNPGEAPLTFTAALHTYLRVADVRRARVEGLRGVPFRDRAAGPGAPPVPDPEPAVTVAGEVDRLYLGAPPELRVRDEAGGRELRVTATGFRDAVVWNPWRELAARLPDLGDDEYLEMLCVEAAQVGEPVTLAPGASWRGSQRLDA